MRLHEDLYPVQPGGCQPGDGVHVMAEALRNEGREGKGGGGQRQREEGRPEERIRERKEGGHSPGEAR